MDINIGTIDLAMLPRPAKAGSYIAELEAAHRERRLRMSRSLVVTTPVPNGVNTQSPTPGTDDKEVKGEDVPETFIKHEGPTSIAHLAFVACSARSVRKEELFAEAMTSRARMTYYIVCFLSAYHSGVEPHEIGWTLGGKSAERIATDISRAKTLVREDETVALDTVVLEHELRLVRWGERSRYAEQEKSTTPEKPKEWWEHFIPAVGGIIKFKMALREVAFVRDVSEDEIKSSQRNREQVHARQLLCLLAKRHTKRSLPEIGRLVGGRDHTTVLHSVRKAEKLMLDDADFASDVVFIEHRLGVVRWGDRT